MIVATLHTPKPRWQKLFVKCGCNRQKLLVAFENTCISQNHKTQIALQTDASCQSSPYLQGFEAEASGQHQVRPTEHTVSGVSVAAACATKPHSAAGPLDEPVLEQGRPWAAGVLGRRQAKSGVRLGFVGGGGRGATTDLGLGGEWQRVT